MKKHPLWYLGEHALGHFNLTLGASHFTIPAYQAQSTKNAYESGKNFMFKKNIQAT